MSSKDLKSKIISSLKNFSEKTLIKSSLSLFHTLGYNIARQSPLDEASYACFKSAFIFEDTRFDEEKAVVSEWKGVDLLFQLSAAEISSQISFFDTSRVDNTLMESYLFFAIELSGQTYTRTILSRISRELNKIFPMPVMVIFKYGQNLTLSVINRRLNERDENKDVLKKVTLIKDINFENPHRAHIEILHDLSFDELYRVYRFTNFVELHNAWQKTLDIKELNKKFYQELSIWYFWAMDKVSFPDDAEKDMELRNATGLIRLITRVIFIWFLKEKELVPDILFNKSELRKILKKFNSSNTDDSYYRAILQNLFFGTLNQQK
jgi:adenine-specific DNA-methyltransferase